MRVFVSYSDGDREFARRVVALCKEKRHETFVAFADCHPPSGRWLPELCKRIDTCDAFALCLSAPSLKAYFQKTEWQYAVSQRKRCLVVYSGPWRDAYGKPENFPFLPLDHRYDWDSPLDREKALRALGYPHEDRFRFMQEVLIEAGTQLMLQHGLEFLKGKPEAVDQEKNVTTEVDVAVQSDATDALIVERSILPPSLTYLAAKTNLVVTVPPDTELKVIKGVLVD